MRAAFTEKYMEDLVTNDGYVIVDFLNPDELEEIQKNTKELGFGIYNEEILRITITHDSVEEKNEIFEKFSSVLQNAANKFLQNYKLIRVAIFDKLPGGGWVRPHQHPHLVDESKYKSLAIWIPLTDTTVEMGTLHVVNGSLKIFIHKIRTHNDTRAFEGVSRKIIKKYSTPLPLKAGQAVIFHDRLIHWSPPNKSSRIRTAFALELMPKESELIIYYRDNDQDLLKYAIDAKTFQASVFPLKRKPDNLELLGIIKQSYISYNNRQFIAMMQGACSNSTNRNRNLFQRLFNRQSPG